MLFQQCILNIYQQVLNKLSCMVQGVYIGGYSFSGLNIEKKTFSSTSAWIWSLGNAMEVRLTFDHEIRASGGANLTGVAYA